MSALGGLLLFLGLGIGVVFGIILLIKAFQTSVLWGLAYLFIPFAALVYVFTHWEQSKKPFLSSLIGIPLVVLGVVIMVSQAEPSDFTFESTGGSSTITFSSDDSERRPSSGGTLVVRRGNTTSTTSGTRPARQPEERVSPSPSGGDFSSQSEARFRGVNLWDMEELVREYPADIGARYELAARQAAVGRWDQAVGNLEQAAELFSQSPESESSPAELHAEILDDQRFRALLAERPAFKQSLRDTQEGITIDFAPR